MVEPEQTVVVPEIVPADGSGLTVIAAVATAVPQLFVTEYDIVAVPAVPPVTTPALTAAIVELLLVQAPPLTASVNVVVEPEQTVVVPDIVPADGSGINCDSSGSNCCTATSS